MRYRHCDIHDCESTNGCIRCATQAKQGLCPACGYEFEHKENEQVNERLDKLTRENSVMKQEILKKDREIARMTKTIGEMYIQVHGKPMVRGVF